VTERPKSAEQARRTARLAAALRENLKRRKAQARHRGDDRPTAGASAAPPHDSAEIAADKPKR